MSRTDRTDWSDRPINLASSARGVYAFPNPWDGLLRGEVAPWPPPELVQKVYQSSHQSAYRGADFSVVTSAHGYYTDLQSVHSEDALTWSLFGLLAYADLVARSAFVAELLSLVLGETEAQRAAHVWLWRRLPHPDTLVSGGPEVDFGIQTDRVLLLGEGKWLSQVSSGQGADGTKDQIQLRSEFCERYGTSIYPGVERFVVLLVSKRPGALTEKHYALESDKVRIVNATWEQVGGLSSNPWRGEFLKYLAWREANSRAQRDNAVTEPRREPPFGSSA